MTSPPTASFLDFFVLEASEYVEQMDKLLARAAPTGPDPEALQRASRALRGSATMAKLSTFAELASTVESVGRALRQGAIGWDEAIKGALTAAIDDLKILVRAARTWSPAEDQWALNRIAELAHFVKSGAPAPQPTAAASTAFFANEATQIAAGLDTLATRPSDQDQAIMVLRRVRALRGVAGVRDISALAEVSEAAEIAVRPMELGAKALSHESLALLRAAAELMRTLAAGLPSGQKITPATPQYRAFLAALDGMSAQGRGADRVIPIANLFHDDAGPHIVEKSPHPPTTPGQRFRMEVVSLGEHLHKVIDEARVAVDDIQREHARSELGRALRAIRATAASFEQMAVAQTVEGYLEQTGDLNAAALDAISTFAATISPAAVAPTPITSEAVAGFRMTHVKEAVSQIGLTAPRSASSPPSAFDAPKPPAPAPTPFSKATPVPAPPAQPRSPAQHARVMEAVHVSGAPSGNGLDGAIAAFDSLAGERFAEPIAISDELVPIAALLYRGRSALDRAIELRDRLRRAGGSPAPEVLDEIYDLLDLARAS